MGSAVLKRLRLAVFVAVLVAFLPSASSAFLMEEHRRLTFFAIGILRMEHPDEWRALEDLKGVDPRIRDMAYSGINYAPEKPGPEASLAERLGWEALAPDFFADLEFVDVDFGRDDPHTVSITKNRDEAGYSTNKDILLGTVEAIIGMEHANFTAFDHFIDIGSYGHSLYDDYDGYSYQFVLKHVDQYQKDWRIGGKSIDDGIMWYYNDEYVHVPGMKWYRGCSPAAERYSFPPSGKDNTAELLKRFPLAESIGKEGLGIPYTVFFPVDNMARYWYGAFLETLDPLDLGPVMHAVGDAAIPHHTAGCLGNWHQQYETDIGEYVKRFVQSFSCRDEAAALAEKWEKAGSEDPGGLAPGDWKLQPSSKWSVENLVTWMALNTYRTYVERYAPYYREHGESIVFENLARRSVIQLAAVKVLILRKAAREAGRGSS